jgi:hypothetical protein
VGLADDWPCDPEEFGEVVNSLEFTSFTHDKAPTGGWGLHLVIDELESQSVPELEILLRH